jgi:hypothetical protein
LDTQKHTRYVTPNARTGLPRNYIRDDSNPHEVAGRQETRAVQLVVGTETLRGKLELARRPAVLR